jgi:hypothetical protein
MRLYRSRCGLAGAQEGYSRRCSDRLNEPSQAIPRHGCIPAEPAAVSPGKIIVPRIVIGGVILDQPAGCGIGAAKRGASSLRSRGAALRRGFLVGSAALAAGTSVSRPFFLPKYHSDRRPRRSRVVILHADQYSRQIDQILAAGLRLFFARRSRKGHSPQTQPGRLFPRECDPKSRAPARLLPSNTSWLRMPSGGAQPS